MISTVLHLVGVPSNELEQVLREHHEHEQRPARPSPFDPRLHRVVGNDEVSVPVLQGLQSLRELGDRTARTACADGEALVWLRSVLNSAGDSLQSRGVTADEPTVDASNRVHDLDCRVARCILDADETTVGKPLPEVRQYRTIEVVGAVPPPRCDIVAGHVSDVSRRRVRSVENCSRWPAL